MNQPDWRWNILVTGSHGQLGSELRELAPLFPMYQMTFTDIDELDITKPEAVNEFLSVRHFHFIINTAGYTAVDQAESEPSKAFLVNSDAVGYLAQAAHQHHSILIHFSTDYIFSGDHSQPISEDSPAYPLSVYGKSKLKGEQLARKLNPRTIILRTSWLYSFYGKNFIKTIISKGQQNKILQVVYDQIGSPTYAFDLAYTVLQLLPRWIELPQGLILHYSNEGVASWYDLAVETVRLYDLDCKIVPILTNDYPLPAPRPRFSLLSKEKIRKLYQIEIPYWRDSLKVCIEKIKSSALLSNQ